jgi:malate dehydrogenase (oxaloacetate-decarboxylating)(NADP+)
LTAIRAAKPILQESSAKPCNILQTKANRPAIGLIPMGKGNKTHTLPHTIAARRPLNNSALAGPPVTHYS